MELFYLTMFSVHSKIFCNSYFIKYGVLLFDMVNFAQDERIDRSYRKRITLFLVCLGVIFSIIVIRLFYLQILQGPYYKEKSEKNRVRILDISPVRGNILDRNGYILATNNVSFELNIIPSECNPIRNVSKVLSHSLGLDADLLFEKINKAKKRNPFVPVTIKKNLNVEEVSRILARNTELPGILIEEKSKRVYPLGNFMSHVLGYVGEVNQRELEKLSGMGYRVGDVIGRMGIERLMEGVLRGKRGGVMVETDAFGRILNVVSKVLPTNGEDVYLSIDFNLQEVVESELEGIEGAIVCLEPKTGKVVALGSSPGFDPNIFVEGLSGKAWEALSKDPSKPLLNKVLSGIYPPGSVFKIVVAIAALEEGITNEKETVYCTGGYQFGNREFGCWREHGHGTVDMRRALVESCDYYFYEMGRRLGVDRIAHYAKLLGLGVDTGSGLVEEKLGIVPTSEWKKKNLKAPWYPGETLSLAIGQGYLAITPIQVARMISGVFTGVLPKISFLLLDSQGETEEVLHLPIKQKNLEIVRNALWGVVNELRGTGGKARLEGFNVCGKTGTAQTRSVNIVEKDINKVPYHLRDHAWFAAVAPKEDPQLAVVVLVEHGGHGGSAAAPIAGRIFERYFSKE